MGKAEVRGGKMFERGKLVRTGNFSVLAGGIRMDTQALGNATVLASLQEDAPESWPADKPHLLYPVLDFSAPDLVEWKAWLEEEIIPRLEEGARLAVHCTAGIGRTGMFLASLVALLECVGDADADPIAEVRERYRPNAVETIVQGKLVFNLIGRELPKMYYRVLRS